MKSIMRMLPSRNFLIIALLLLLIAGMLFLDRKKSSVTPSPDLELLPLRTASGWGYRILANHHPFIYQPFIPALPGQRPFPSEKLALEAGAIVLRKLRHNQQPTLTDSDLARLGISGSR